MLRLKMDSGLLSLSEIKMNKIIELLASYIGRNPDIAYDVLDILMKHLKQNPDLAAQLVQAIIMRLRIV